MRLSPGRWADPWVALIFLSLHLHGPVYLPSTYPQMLLSPKKKKKIRPLQKTGRGGGVPGLVC